MATSGVLARGCRGGCRALVLCDWRPRGNDRFPRELAELASPDRARPGGSGRPSEIKSDAQPGLEGSSTPRPPTPYLNLDSSACSPLHD